ncbi:MAG TPA: amidohydrolase family protein [Pseudolabrys sp.]|nr:amidohydrolase family protein [Pseudolabrys sp.]
MRCDSHVHIVGAPDRYPQLAERTYFADVATLERLESVSAARAIRHFVIVQPSFYGVDNSLLLDSLDALGGRGRGVAVVDPELTSARTLSSMARQGVRGLRLNLYSPLREKLPLAARIEAVGSLAHELNWHIEIVAALKMLSDNAALLASSRVPLVIDHYGLYAGFRPDQSESVALLKLLAMPFVWIKLSAPYRVSGNSSATKPDPAWLAAIVAAAQDRCVWGSDWPHTPPHEAQMGSAVLGAYRNLRYETLVDDFVEAIGSAELAERILSDNPTRLYGLE